MAINKQLIHSALTHVLHPNFGKDLITLDLIQDVVIQDKFVTFCIELPDDNPKLADKLTEDCKEKIRTFVDEDIVFDIQTEVNTFRQAELEENETGEMESGANPMNMEETTADNYVPPATIDPVPYEEMPSLLQQFMDEHQQFLDKLKEFEQALIQFKKNGWRFSENINSIFGQFFNYVDDEIMPHNQLEEKELFPLLKKRLLEKGEHSQYQTYIEQGTNRTSVEVMENEHIKLIQLSALTFNFLGLSQKLPDATSQAMVADLAYEQGRQLVELLRLHIQREDKTLFPQACALIDKQEFGHMQQSQESSVN